MSHCRLQIQEKIAVLLSDIAGVSVHANRYHTLDQDDLPAILVFFDSEEVTGRSAGSLDPDLPRNTERRVTFEIQIQEKAKDDLVARMDAIDVEVERILARNRLLDGMVSDLRLASTSMSLEGEGDQPVGMMRMAWEADYWCLEDNPEEAR